MFRAIGRWTPTFVILAGIVYFAAHGLSGDSGVLAWIGYKQRLGGLEVELAMAVDERLALQNQASRLREESLDLDYLEERARALAGVSRPEDIIIPIDARD